MSSTAANANPTATARSTHRAMSGSHLRLVPATADLELLSTFRVPPVAILRTVLREMWARPESPRVNEPDLVMDDPRKVQAYIDASREGGVMDPVYIYHGAQICSILRPGDVAIDLGCGPAHLLCMVARLNPDVDFIGVDMSDEALTFARRLAEAQGLENVTFRQGDMTHLDSFTDQSVDAVFSTLALHHLPDAQALHRTFAEIDRVLRPGGGLYLTDLTHLKRERSVLSCAFEHRERQPELFTLDYLYSLRAAFTHDDFRAAHTRNLAHRGTLHPMRLAHYGLSIKSPARRSLPQPMMLALRHKIAKLARPYRIDVRAMSFLFRLGGLRSAL